jgi:hypothetical protein
VSVADVDGRRDPVAAVAGDEALGEGRVPQRRGPDHGPRRSRAERTGHRLGRPQPTAYLDPRPSVGLGHDVRGELELDRLPRHGAVEVDDVDPGRSFVDEPPRDRRRVGFVDRLVVEVALAQPDDPPVAQVDRREELEARHAPPALTSC